ncbi:unnamed protein product [Caenorhabditis sp. 36 PRJEB53466]|nr:unnamed protein product [Caenorhabditis sp. 36 PRJEB53466]
MSKKREKEMDDAKMRKALRMETGEDKNLESRTANLGAVLPAIQKKKGPVSNEDFEKLFHALCGDTGKEYDSDDSFITDIMDDEEAEEKDRKFKECMESVKTMNQDYARIKKILNIGKETAEQKEARRRALREQNEGLTTDEQKEAAEQKRLRAKNRQIKRMEEVVQVFTEKQRPKNLPFVPCGVFGSLLEAMADVLPDDDESTDYSATINAIGEDVLAARIKYMGIKGCFDTEGKSTEQFLKKKARKILKNTSVIDVFNSTRYGFNFNTKKALLALENYYTLNKPCPDNGSSVTDLGINMHNLVRSAFHVERSGNSHFKLTDTLKMTLFDL